MTDIHTISMTGKPKTTYLISTTNKETRKHGGRTGNR
jgi:hypothetical protein